MAPSKIDSLNFGNSQLNYTYSINCLIKTLKYNDFQITLEKKNPKKILKSRFKFVFITKKFKERWQ
jgi:hypothetical protein